MELRGTKTEEILYKALYGELKASFHYRCFAEMARKLGMKQIADIFEATAQNEIEHARHEFEFLGGAGDTIKNIEQAIHGEAVEATRFYPESAEIAEGEGFTQIASFFRKMSKAEAKHEKSFRDLLGEIEKGGEFEGRTVGHSAVEMAQVMLPEQANPAGFVHGGELMKFMDNAAFVVAARHSGGLVVTGQVENIKFINSVHVGDLVIVRGKIIFAGRSSMEVQIEVEAEDLTSGHTEQRVPALTALFVMVALDSKGKIRKVPAIILSTEEEERIFAEGQERYKSRKK
ncbi:ferritin family protein [Chloroflexota bacterium]